MRFIVMHKTNARWEASEVPCHDLIESVGALIGAMSAQNILLNGEGLRATSLGVRLRFSGGERTVIPGPFAGENELTAGFDVVRVRSLDEAIAWATRRASLLGDVEMDIRPVTEPWDIGMAPRPAGLDTQRYMVLRKAGAKTPSQEPWSDGRRAQWEGSKGSEHLGEVNVRTTARGRRYKHSEDGLQVIDGPFAESKEMIAGYVLLSLQSFDEADHWARRYQDVVGAHEVDLFEVFDDWV